MSPQTAKRERAEQMLGELAELSLMLARELAVQARAAEEPEEKVALAAAFQKAARTVRLTLALDFKLQRDAARDAREADREAADAERRAAEIVALNESRVMQAAQAALHEMTDPTPVQRQKARVKSVLNRLIWNESEGDEEDYEVLLEDLDARLYEAEDAPGFADLPIEVLARRLAADMRLSGELVITTAAAFTPANAPLPLADTG